MNKGVEVREELATAGHVVGSTAVKVPAIHLVLAEAGVEEHTCPRFVDAEAGVGLAAEDVLLCFQLQEAVGEEQSCLVIIRLRDVRCAATLASRLRAILRPVAGAMAVEAGVVAVRVAFAAGATSLLSLLLARRRSIALQRRGQGASSLFHSF